MHHCLRLSSMALLSISLLSAAQAVWAEEQESGFTPLFDGESLAGWEGDTAIFRVEKGAIVGGSLKERVAHNEFLCTTKEYGDFELRLQAKLTGEGKNAGIQFRSQRIPDHFEVRGFQCDIGEMRSRPIWGWLYDESRRRKFLAEADDEKLSAKLKPTDWNDIVIRCQGDHIQIWVNGYQTVDYVEKEEGIDRQGIIGLQIHGGPPAEASYRKIRIKELKDG